jgi:hypothetical protein
LFFESVGLPLPLLIDCVIVVVGVVDCVALEVDADEFFLLKKYFFGSNIEFQILMRHSNLARKIFKNLLYTHRREVEIRV